MEDKRINLITRVLLRIWISVEFPLRDGHQHMLPEQGKYLSREDIAVTGSLYQNPVIDSTCTVKLEFSSLGTIGFSME